MTNGNFIGLATRASQNYAEAQEYESKIMEDYVKRLEGVYRNIQNGGYFEEERTIDGGEKGSYNPTIPEGFKPVDTEDSKWGDGTTAPDKADVNKGLVIEDKDGNQFVWVPCTTEETAAQGLTKYARHKYNGDHNDAETDKWGTDQWPTRYYGAYSDWYDPAGDDDSKKYTGYTVQEGEESQYGLKSVQKYGGFYVARFEAGIPESSTSLYPQATNDGYTYTGGKIINGVYNNDTVRNTGNIAPVSKKNTPSWSWISQTNAKSAAEKMLEGKSHLIDGTAWDTIVDWINQPGVTVTDSKTVGNYYTSGGKIPEGTMYIKHTYDSKWTTGEKYQKADNNVNHPGGKGTDRIEVYTGSLGNTKLKNIYDMAGNMWEWTTETGKHGEESGSSYAVLRGGGFYDDATSHPLCKRQGNVTVTRTSFNFGFRAVLYL